MGMPVGETYIVRIYRREGRDPERVVGMVEKVGESGEHPFRDASEMTDLIVRGPGPGREGTNRKA